MELAIKLTQFFLSLSILIILHELGHFIPAKIFKTKVEKFYLFFDVKFSLFKKKIGETEYGIGWLPLGGYVKISGMIDESMDKEQMLEEPKPWEFRSKPAWQRLIIMLGGVTVNFILAFVIYIGMAFFYGESYIPNSELKDGILVTHPAIEKAGIKTGDKIISIDGDKIIKFDVSINEKLMTGKQVIIERDGKPIEIQLPLDIIDQLMKEKMRLLVSLRMPFAISEVPSDSPNKSVLKAKDLILSVDGVPVKYHDEVVAILQTKKGAQVQAVILRNQKELPLTLQVNAAGRIGVITGALGNQSINQLGIYKLNKEEYGLFESIPVGIEKGKDQLAGYVKQLQVIFNPDTGAYKGIGGFKAIFDIFPTQWSWEYFWSITAMLSIMLGVMNLLPIPALDGGHVMFVLFEMISGKKPSDKFMEYAQLVGFVLLISLLVFANGNDIYRAFLK